MSAQAVLPGMEPLFSVPALEPLSFQAKRLLEVLMGYYRPNGRCFPKQSSLAADLRWTRETVCRYMAELKAWGLRVVRRGAGRYSACYENLPEVHEKATRSHVEITSDEPPSLYESPMSQTTEESCAARPESCHGEQGSTFQESLAAVAKKYRVPVPRALEVLKSIQNRLKSRIARAVSPAAYLLKCLRTELEMQELIPAPEPLPDLSAILDECLSLYRLAGRPVPPKHQNVAMQLLISHDKPAELVRLPNYIKWALGTGLWPSPAKTKSLVNLISEGDWNVELVARALPAPPKNPAQESKASAGIRRFLEKGGDR